ncbi:MAG: ABZJ_00895 family protein [Pseudomonadota bacterium]
MSNSKILRRFAVVCFLTILAVMALSVLFAALADFDVGAGVGIVTILVPAMEAGQTYVRRTGTLLEKPRMWRLSIFFTLINLAFGIVVMLATMLVAPMALMPVLSSVGLAGLLVVTVIVCGIYTVAARFFLGFGQNGALKRQEKMQK